MNKKSNLIYPCGFEIIDPAKQKEQEKGIDEVIKKGYMPVFIFNDDSNNVKKLIPTKFKENIEKHPAYRAWIEMLMRCYDAGHHDYKDVGGKGVGVYYTWIASFEQFCKDMEITPNME